MPLLPVRLRVSGAMTMRLGSVSDPRRAGWKSSAGAVCDMVGTLRCASQRKLGLRMAGPKPGLPHVRHSSREWKPRHDAPARGTCGAARVYRPDRRERRSEEHTSELQSRQYLVCRLLLEKKKNSVT